MRICHLACAAAVLAAMASGCASTPTSYYTLDMRPSAEAAPDGLAFRHVVLSDTLAGMGLPILSTPTTMEYYEGAQWTGSLEDIVREKFQSEFGGVTVSHAKHVVDGHVIAFAQRDLPGGSAEAYAKIELMVRDSGESRYAAPLMARIYEHAEPMEAATPDHLAAALSRCIERIAAMARADAAAL